jgi:thiamine kinase-like enzyme
VPFIHVEEFSLTMSLSLEEAIAHLPAWARTHDLQVQPLSGGMTNHNYRLEVGMEAFVLRISGANTALLGLDRAREYAATVAAARIGVAPEVVYFDQATGLLLTRFIAGRTWSPTDLRQPANIRRVAETLKRVHRLPPIEATFSPWAAVTHMSAAVQCLGVPLPRNFAWLLAQIRGLEAVSSHAASVPCLCHNDVWTGNMLDDGTLRLIDWEFAGMGDVHLDLATLIMNHNFSVEHERMLLESYFGTLTAAHTEQVGRMKRVMLLFDGLWALIQLGSAGQGHDFQAYADRSFRRLAQMLPQV